MKAKVKRMLTHEREIWTDSKREKKIKCVEKMIDLCQL